MADGINKLIIAKKETSWGVKPAASGAQLFPRVTGNFQVEKDAYESALINPSQQVRDSRHGTRRATGSLQGELACGIYEMFIAAALRRDFAATGASYSGTDIAFAATPAFTRTSGSFLTDGFMRGMIVDVTGSSVTGNNKRAVITDVNALTMDAVGLDGLPFSTDNAGESVTIAGVGQLTYTPQTGHTDDSFAVEEWHSDISLSSITLGQQVNSMNISVSPNSMVTIGFEFLGKDGEATTGTQYFTSPTAVPGEGTMSAPAGIALINGSKTCRMTSFNGTIANNITQESVIACEGIGAKSRGKVMATGSASMILDDGDIQDWFFDETEIEFTYVFAAQDGEAFGLYAPRFKINNVTKDDGEKVIILSFDWQALEYTGTDADKENTTLVIQDTTLA